MPLFPVDPGFSCEIQKYFDDCCKVVRFGVWNIEILKTPPSPSIPVPGVPCGLLLSFGPWCIEVCWALPGGGVPECASKGRTAGLCSVTGDALQTRFRGPVLLLWFLLLMGSPKTQSFTLGLAWPSTEARLSIWQLSRVMGRAGVRLPSPAWLCLPHRGGTVLNT